jgi:hypothetical protein
VSGPVTNHAEELDPTHREKGDGRGFTAGVTGVLAQESNILTNLVPNKM